MYLLKVDRIRFIFINWLTSGLCFIQTEKKLTQNCYKKLIKNITTLYQVNQLTDIFKNVCASNTRDNDGFPVRTLDLQCNNYTWFLQTETWHNVRYWYQYHGTDGYVSPVLQWGYWTVSDSLTFQCIFIKSMSSRTESNMAV